MLLKDAGSYTGSNSEMASEATDDLSLRDRSLCQNAGTMCDTSLIMIWHVHCMPWSLRLTRDVEKLMTFGMNFPFTYICIEDKKAPILFKFIYLCDSFTSVMVMKGEIPNCR